LVNKLLKQHLAKHGYDKLKHTPGLFKHHTRPILFTLVVNNFGIPYEGAGHLKHLLNILKLFYNVEVNMSGGLYCGITLDWHYKDKYVDISMPNYVWKQLIKYKWDKPKRAQHCPFEPNPVHYGRKSDEIKQ